MKAKRGEARATDLNFLPPAGHAAGLAASVLWTFPLTTLDPGRRGGDMGVRLGLRVGVGIPVGRIFGGSWAGRTKEADVRLANG